MSEGDLDLLITLDDPGEEEEGDAIDHLLVEDTVIGNGPYPVVFGQGDWTCAIAKLAVTTDDPMVQPANQKFEIGACIVTCSKNGTIVERKVFYDLAGMQKQIGVSQGGLQT